MCFGVVIFFLFFGVFMDMPQSCSNAGAVVIVLVRFSKINRKTKVFALFFENEAVDDKSVYPGRTLSPP
jgi:hypothetical protein